MSLRLTPYFVMNGNAQEAIEFYERALGASVLFKQTFGEMPSNPDYPLPDSANNLIGHAMIKVGESDLMFSDTFGGDEARIGNQVTICITLQDVEEAHRIFNALSDGGQVVTPLMETHFSPAYGSVTDKFGITFQFFTEGKM
ncbi:VOC family protein [Paenibacillus sacheonensis]|uniref:VOC family protein n=1 Tax=Paenibacillus sacheonensis TaxID=742054 RepID=A0A7X5BZF2_9BACL|nr:VOC family protein [Paenibacillus sacheonensis]MBM7566670.1 PhnB protein [Paenibacillus sacheonensis]NBC70652.1 VOC family protein [Paenibacillus sacheonensis]